MFNPYSLILALFSLAGLAAALWAGRRIAKARASRDWPSVEATVTESRLRSKTNPTPQVVVDYEVGGQRFQHTLATPTVSDTTPEIGQRFVNQYPVGSTLKLYHHPLRPAQASQHAGAKGEDWFALAAGIGAMIFGLALLFFSG